MKKSFLILTVLLLCGTMVFAGGRGENAGGSSGSGNVEISIMMGDDINKAGFDAVCALAKEKLGITVVKDIVPVGDDGTNTKKARLAAGEMTDLVMVLPGARLVAENPAEYYYDLTNQPFASRLDDTYKATASLNGAVYSIPYTSSQAGAVLYNKPLYAKYNLQIPKTWAQFMENCRILDEAGVTAVYGSLADKWTSQLGFLGDNYNVVKAAPNFLADFEAGKDKYATNAVARRGFEKLADLAPFYNVDYLAATFEDGCSALVNGEAAQWLMLTRALSTIYELYGEKVNEIGVFPIPGDNANDTGLTVWMPDSLSCYKMSPKIEAVLAFMDLYISDEGINAYGSKLLPEGPYCVKGFELPDNAYAGVKDMQVFFDMGKTGPAAEFMISVKGANAEAITQECSSGQTTGLQAAQKYDDDCYRMAVQLGLNWQR